MRLLPPAALLLLLAFHQTGQSADREMKVRGDRSAIESDGYWIYNDLPRGIEEAKRTGKPLLVVFRCVPCEACAQLDSDVAERDPLVRYLMDQFVCVRIVHANGLDLSLFQFDYDQSFAAFLMNADKVIYGRYGTRSHETESAQDVSLEGFAQALEGALELHKQYPGNRELLLAKSRGPKPEFPVPEKSSLLQGRYGAKLDYEGQVVQSCIHCHQVGEAKRHHYREQGQPIPEQVLFPYPNPTVLGMVMNPKTKATVREVLPRSSAERAGFQAGDKIRSLEGQPILSTADIQWVLHHAGEQGQLQAEVERAGDLVRLTLPLEDGWRQRDNISWRATSWELRRMVTGGLVLEDLSGDARRRHGLADDALALRVKYVGQWGAHAAGKEAGFKKDDVIVALDGRTDHMTESTYLTYAVNAKRPGERMAAEVLREGKRLKLELPIQ